MELNHLRYFFEVAKSGSFTEAARRLHVSQSALSKAVAQLEDREGLKLFIRSKKGVSLTPVGTEVFEKSRAVFDAIEEIRASAQGKKTIREGHLRFGASNHIVNYLLTDPIQRLIASYPQVIPGIVTGGPNEIVASILANESEFGLFFTKLNIPQLIYEPLLTVEMVVVHSPRIQPKSEKGGIPRLRQLLRKHGYICSVGSQFMHHPSASLIGQLGEFPRVVFECNGQDAQKNFCMKVGGLAYLARFMVQTELQRGSLVEYPLVKKTFLDIQLAKRRGRPLSLNAQTFIELLKQTGDSL